MRRTTHLPHDYCVPGSVPGYTSILSDIFSKQPHFASEEVTLTCPWGSVKWMAGPGSKARKGWLPVLFNLLAKNFLNNIHLERRPVCIAN